LFIGGPATAQSGNKEACLRKFLRLCVAFIMTIRVSGSDGIKA